MKERQKLIKPTPLFDKSWLYLPPTLWIHPPEPSLLLPKYCSNPTILWCPSANGKDWFYVTTEVLSAYSKTWEKSTNIQASQELISNQLEVAQQMANVFAAEVHSFSTYLTGIVTLTCPCEGVVEFESSKNPQRSATPVQASLSIDLALS